MVMVTTECDGIYSQLAGTTFVVTEILKRLNRVISCSIGLS